MATADRSRQIGGERVSPWVKAFVVFHLVAITVWALPQPKTQYLPQPGGGAPKVALTVNTSSVGGFFQSLAEYISNEPLVLNERFGKDSPIKLYVQSTGFWQYWDMFSPNPSMTDIYGDAIVKYKDGSSKVYQYPRMYSLGLGGKYIKERFRKFFERASNPKYRYLFKPFALRIARLNYTDPANPPVEIQLFQHRLPIAPPGEVQAREYSSEQYFQYYVDQSLLTDKGSP